MVVIVSTQNDWVKFTDIFLILIVSACLLCTLVEWWGIECLMSMCVYDPGKSRTPHFFYFSQKGENIPNRLHAYISVFKNAKVSVPIKRHLDLQR